MRFIKETLKVQQAKNQTGYKEFLKSSIRENQMGEQRVSIKGEP